MSNKSKPQFTLRQLRHVSFTALFATGLAAAALGLTACSSILKPAKSSVSPGTMLNQSNIEGTLFVETKNGDVIERRWDGSAQSWVWVDHNSLNSNLSSKNVSNIEGIGPHLCNDGVCRLYIRTDKGTMIYHYDQSAVNPDNSNGPFISNGAVMQRFRVAGVNCESNIIVDSQWRLHCTEHHSSGAATAYKYDLINDQIHDQAYMTSNSTVPPYDDNMVANFGTNKMAYIRGEKLFIATQHSVNQAEKEHPLTRSGIVGIGGNMSDTLYAFRKQNGLEFNRFFEIRKSGNRYDWDVVGNPKYLKDYVPDAGIASIGTKKVAIIGRYKKDKTSFVLERWRSGNDGHWADHGYPAAGKPIKIADPFPGDTGFFIATDTGHLVQRHFANNKWSWSDHGAIP